MPRNMDMSKDVERRNNMKKVLIGCGISLGIFVLIVILLITGLFLLLRGEEQKPPQITTGEFPFVVEYEMNGETFVIEDSVICEFTGYDPSALTYHKPRTWNSRLKSGDEEKCVLIYEENTKSVLTPERVNTRSRLVLDYGSPEYYMGDPKVKSMVDKEASFEYRENWKASEKVTDGEYTKLNKKELEKYFGIKIIRFEFSEPIRNEFK